VPNPEEYEKLCDLNTIIESANAICRGIADSIPSSGEETKAE
jgi:hypothetical protein